MTLKEENGKIASRNETKGVNIVCPPNVDRHERSQPKRDETSHGAEH